MKKKIIDLFFSTTTKKIISTIVILLIVVIPIVTMMLPKNRTCTVLFDVAGGSKIDGQEIKCGHSIIKPEDPIKNGFDFIGWYLEDVEYNFNSSLKNNIILKAKWKNNNTTKVFKVNFDSNGGTDVDPIEISEGEILTEPIPPTKKGYTFNGWYFGDNLYDFTFAILQDLTLTAHWEKETSKDKTPINNNQNNTEVNNSMPNNSNETIANLLGTWYYEQDASVHLRIYNSYIFDKPCLYIVWGSIDLFKEKLYPNYSYNSSSYITLPTNDNEFNTFLKNLNITIENKNKIKVGKYSFTRNKKEVDLTEFDKYIGMWYLVGAENNNTFIEIKKEVDGLGTFYRITTESNQYPAEGIFQQNINEGTHIFNKYKISYNNGYLIYNGKTYSKEKNKEVIHLDDFTIMFGMNTSNSVYLGKTKQYYINPYPNNATALDGTWYSKDNSIAKVDNNGLVSGLKIGTTEICFKSNDNNKTKCEYINVEDIEVTKIIPVKKTMEIYVGESKTVDFNVEPTDATMTKMYLDTDNYNVATVGDTTVTGKSAGTATITISYSKNRNIKAEVTVIVKSVPVSGITLNQSSINLLREESVDLVATIIPNNATNKKITWLSSNQNIATVSSTGKVTAVGKGKTIITAKTVDGEYEAYVQINVTNPPLEAQPSTGISYTCMSGCGMYTFVAMNATGGSGKYTYSVTIKKDGKLLGTFNNDTTYLPLSNGTYEVTYTITDSLGESISGKNVTTLSSVIS